MWQERAGTLVDRLVLAEGRLAALEAPQEPENAVLEPSGSTQSPEPTGAEREQVEVPVDDRPWWRRWRLWLAVLFAFVAVFLPVLD